MIDLERDLTALGDRLAVDDAGLVDDVMARLAAPVARPAPTSRWLVAAAVTTLVLAAALAVPSSRHAIADWFGLDGVRIEQQPDRSVPAGTIGEPPAGIVVDSFAGALDAEVITKVLGAGTGIRRVDVGGRPGLWIDGAPHELVLRGPDGEWTSRRVAGNTLLWQDGDTIHRVEGAPSLADALAVAQDVAQGR